MRASTTKLFKWWPKVDLDPFYTKVNFGHLGYCMGKSDNYIFFLNYYSLRSPSWSKHSTKCVNEVKWVSNVKVIVWSLPKVTQSSKLKLVFLKNSLVILNQISYESLLENGNESLYKWIGLHDQDGHHVHIWYKPLKIFFSRPNRPMALELGM